MKITFKSNSAKETQTIGSKIASSLDDGDVILLSGELGAGKTVFTKGIVRSFSDAQEDPVVSPSFTLIQEYNLKNRVYHIDLYRIDTKEELDELGILEFFGKDGITIIEWADKFPDYFSDSDSLIVHITVESETERIIQINTHNSKISMLHKNLL